MTNPSLWPEGAVYLRVASCPIVTYYASVTRENQQASKDAHPPGHSRDNRWLRQGRERAIVRKRHRVAECGRLVALEGLSFRETAERLGVSYGYVVNTLWPAAKETFGASVGPEDRERIGLFVVESLREIVAVSRSRLGESASYGQVAIRGCVELCHLLGLQFAPNMTSTDSPFSGIFRDHLRSPLLADHEAAIERIKATVAVPVAG